MACTCATALWRLGVAPPVVLILTIQGGRAQLASRSIDRLAIARTSGELGFFWFIANAFKYRAYKLRSRRNAVSFRDAPNSSVKKISAASAACTRSGENDDCEKSDIQRYTISLDGDRSMDAHSIDAGCNSADYFRSLSMGHL
jgi:hypothetical protein